ncbi:MAG: hypothetical protein ABJD97_07795 [Betaproteobacteria bacterium]
MSTNPYAPPVAVVETVPDPDRGSAYYFAVAGWKIVLMSLVTLGLYQIYWFYMNWARVKTRDRSNIMPAPRAIFGFFFCYAMFARVRKDGEAQGLSGPPGAGALATAWIVASLAWRAPGALALLGVLSWFVLLPIQDYANRINAKVAPGHDRNAHLSWLNWIAVVLGGGFFVLVVIGLAIGDH